MRSPSFISRQTSAIVLLSALGFASAIGAGCSQESREFGQDAGGASASVSAAGTGGAGGMTASASSSSSGSASSGAGGNQATPGDLLTAGLVGGTTLLFDIAADKFGDTILAGRYSGKLDFGGMNVLTEAGGNDIFLARFGPTGKPLHARSYGDSGLASVVHAAISPGTVLSGGDVYLAGEIPDVSKVEIGADILKGPGTWVASVNAQGAGSWGYLIPQDMSFPTPYALAPTDQGGSLLVGFFQASLVLASTTLTSAGDTDMFIVKNDSMGKHVWAKRYGGVGHDNATSVAVDASGSIYIGGYFQGSVTFGMNGINSAGGSDVVVAKLGPLGIPKWAARIGGTGEEFAYQTLDVTPAGEVVMGGSASEDITIETTLLKAAGSRDLYIAKFTTDGGLVWANRYGDAGYQDVSSLAVDPDGNTVVIGPFDGQLDFGLGTLTGAPGNSFYLAKLGPSGKPIFARAFTGQCDGLNVAIDHNGAILAAGSCSGLDLGTGQLLLPNGGLFLARFAP